MLFPSPAPPTPPACHQQHPPHSTAMAPHNGGYACPRSRTTRLARRRCPWTTHNHCQQAPQRPQPRVPGASALRRSIRRGPAARSALGAFPRSAQDEAASGGRTSLPPLRSPCRRCARKRFGWKILLKPTVLQVPTSQSNCDMRKDRTHVASQSTVYIILPSNTSTFSNPKSRSLPFSGSIQKKLQSPIIGSIFFHTPKFPVASWVLQKRSYREPNLLWNSITRARPKSEKHHKTKISKSQESLESI